MNLIWDVKDDHLIVGYGYPETPFARFPVVDGKVTLTIDELRSFSETVRKVHDKKL